MEPDLSDFEAWNTSGWDWATMLHYYKKVETFVGNTSNIDVSYHGFSGPMTINEKASFVPLESDKLVDACINSGYPRVSSFQ
jgi:alcohol oxidase